jgi:MoaA/NifB/PqqE/SkfB family radical SAM enzyme
MTRLEYDIEADFLPLTTCNFRCSYCFLPPSALGASLVVHGSNEQWQEAFDATGLTWLIHITGGEPFIYPNFVDLCERLSRRHYLSINSNLSRPSVDAFADAIDPSRVHYINAALHHEERERRTKLAAFIARVRRLQNSQFTVLTSLVMTPSLVEVFPDLAAECESQGVVLLPKVLRGLIQGVRYPGAYSDEHKALLREYTANAVRKYAGTIEQMNEAPTINMFAEDRILDGPNNYFGQSCGSGYNFVVIKPDSTIYRCGSGQRLGNLLRHDLRLLNGPQECDTSYCKYFCEKYTSAEHLGRRSKLDAHLAPDVSAQAHSGLRQGRFLNVVGNQ